MESHAMRKRSHSSCGTESPNNKKLKSSESRSESSSESTMSTSTTATQTTQDKSLTSVEADCVSAEQCTTVAETITAVDTVETIVKLIETELECGVCKDILLDSCVLPCGHIFCGFCIRMWLFHSDTCPVCRSYTDFIITMKSLDNFLDLIIRVVKPDCVSPRSEALIERREIIQREEAAWMSVQQQHHLHRHPHQIVQEEIQPPVESQIPATEMWQEWVISSGIGGSGNEQLGDVNENQVGLDDEYDAEYASYIPVIVTFPTLTGPGVPGSDLNNNNIYSNSNSNSARYINRGDVGDDTYRQDRTRE